jgi:bacterioferritin
MLPARTDEKVLGYLGRALSLELSAVQLYGTQARLAANWGLDEAAARLRDEAHEELGHAERIIARMLAHGAAPGASQLRPVKLGGDLRELLLVDQAFEQELVGLYAAAVRHCQRAGNHDDRAFFQSLLEEEQAHERELEAWVDRLGEPPNAERRRRPATA